MWPMCFFCRSVSHYICALISFHRYALSLHSPQVFHLFTLRRNCVYFLHFPPWHPLHCMGSILHHVTIVVFFFFFLFFVSLSTFSTCSIFDKFTARCYPQPLFFLFIYLFIYLFFFRAAQTQSAPIKHKVLFSPVDVVIPPTLENWQKQQ